VDEVAVVDEWFLTSRVRQTAQKKVKSEMAAAAKGTTKKKG
jgi:hypothetical protein